MKKFFLRLSLLCFRLAWHYVKPGTKEEMDFDDCYYALKNIIEHDNQP